MAAKKERPRERTGAKENAGTENQQNQGNLTCKNKQVFSASDLADNMRRHAESLGLVVDVIEADGVLHRCGVTGRPNDKNGAYIAFADSPASIWCRNWRSGDEGSWCAIAGHDMSASEKDALRQRVAAAKNQAEIAREAAWADGAERARRLLKALPAADAENGYLKRKGVPPLPNIKQTYDGKLAVPVLGEDGLPQSVQFIDADGSKRFLSGGKTEGGFFPIPAADGGKGGPLLIAEGYATAASLNMATGYACLVAFNAGNLLSVAKMARGKYPGRVICLCADNDIRQPDDACQTNTGVEYATKTAHVANARLAVCPVHGGRATDFNDLHAALGLEAVRQVVEAALKKPAFTMPEGFFLVPEGKKAGLYKLETKPDGDSSEILLGPPLYVRGMTRDAESNAWGLLLGWRDPDGRAHQWAMPLELLTRQNAEWYGILANGGWQGVPGTRSKLAAFLSLVRPEKRVRCVPCVGWHGAAFVLPDAVFGGGPDEDVVLQSASHHTLYKIGGTLEGWRELAALACGNSRLELATCAAFAGPLLDMACVESGGFNLVSGSSTGKTTALRLAASVWDGPAYVRSWRATDNALEGVAALHTGTCLVLDELGQADPRAVSAAAYMLTNGRGKARAGRDGNPQKTHMWRLLFLSSGEVGLADKLGEIGQKTRAGQEVRLVDVPADAGAGMGIFEELHGLPDAGALAMRIRDLAEQHYGHAGRAFLQALTADRERVTAEMSQNLSVMVDALCPAGADGQVRRVAMRFAVCAVAGILAKQAGLLPEGFNATGCVERCFNDWLAHRGGVGASEDSAILSAVRLFIEQHGASRFEDMDNPNGQRVINRVGFKKTGVNGTEFLILPESFKAEVAKGYSAKRAGKVLFDAGWLQYTTKGNYQTVRRLPELGLSRAYVITLPTEEQGN